MSNFNLVRKIGSFVKYSKNRNVSSLIKIIYFILIKNFRELRAGLNIKHLYGPRKIKNSNKDVVVLCVFRDGLLYLPNFLNHHRQLGVTHFVFLDNGSTDSSIEWLKKQSDVTLFGSRLAFRYYQLAFRRFLVRKYGRCKWVLLLDIDECFDFPFSSRLSLKKFISYLEENSYDAVVGQMLDVYSDRPVLGPPPENEFQLSKHYNYFELDGLRKEKYSTWFGETNELADDGIMTFWGGVRKTFFDCENPLTKHPLFYCHKNIGITSDGHNISYARIADVSSLIVHYKFTSDFSAVLSRALREECYFGGSINYKPIGEKLEKNPDLSLFSKRSVRLEGTDRLVDEGFLYASEDYKSWVSKFSSAPTQAM